MMMEVGDEMKMARGWLWWIVGVVRFGVGWIVLWGSLARSILASTGLSKPPPKTQTGPRALINHRLPSKEEVSKKSTPSSPNQISLSFGPSPSLSSPNQRRPRPTP
jgi:hypothetical protein